MQQTLARHALVIAATLISLLLGGCSGYQDPAVTSAGVTLTERSSEALTLRLAIDLHNPNNEPLKLLEFDYSVLIDGVDVYEGVRAAETTLAASGHKEVSIPAVVRYDTMKWMNETVIPKSATYQVRGSLRYLTPGGFAQALFDTGLRKPSASFGWSGTAELTVVEPATTRAAAVPAPAGVGATAQTE